MTEKLTSAQVRAKLEDWLKELTQAVGKLMYTIEERDNLIEFRYDGLLYEIIEYYQSDGMYPRWGKEYVWRLDNLPGWSWEFERPGIIHITDVGKYEELVERAAHQEGQVPPWRLKQLEQLRQERVPIKRLEQTEAQERFGYEVGDKTLISTEEPVYHEGKDISGMNAEIIGFKGAKATIRLETGEIIDWPTAMLRAKELIPQSAPAKEPTITELDTLRSDLQKKYFPPEGHQDIWRYDIVSRDAAFADAQARQDYDAIQAVGGSTKRYALLGPGIVTSMFDTVEGLEELIKWVAKTEYGSTQDDKIHWRDLPSGAEIERKANEFYYQGKLIFWHGQEAREAQEHLIALSGPRLKKFEGIDNEGTKALARGIEVEMREHPHLTQEEVRQLVENHIRADPEAYKVPPESEPDLTKATIARLTNELQQMIQKKLTHAAHQHLAEPLVDEIARNVHNLIELYSDQIDIILEAFGGEISKITVIGVLERWMIEYMTDKVFDNLRIEYLRTSETDPQNYEYFQSKLYERLEK